MRGAVHIPPGPDPRTPQEQAEHNAVAWLALTDHELIERSASVGLAGDLHPDPAETAEFVTYDLLALARAGADAHARLHAGDEFVDAWIAEHRGPVEWGPFGARRVVAAGE